MQFEQWSFDSCEFTTQSAAELGQGGPRRQGVVCMDEVCDGFGLVETQASVEKGSSCEFPRPSHGGPRRQTGVEHQPGCLFPAVT